MYNDVQGSDVIRLSTPQKIKIKQKLLNFHKFIGDEQNKTIDQYDTDSKISQNVN